LATIPDQQEQQSMPRTKAKPSRKRKTRPTSDVIDQDGNVFAGVGDPWKKPDDAAAQMASVYLMAVGHVSLYGQSISDACDTFKNFTESKIEAVDTDDMSHDIIKQVFSITLDLLEELVPGGDNLVAVGKFLRDKLIDGVRGVLEIPVSRLGAGELTKDSLTQMMRDLAAAGRALELKWTTASPGGEAGAPTVVLDKMASIVSGLQSNVKAKARWAVERDDKQTEFLDMFYDATSAETAALLDYFYAVPTPTHSAQAGWALYKTLLRRFSKVYAWASASKRDQSMHAKGHPSSVQSTAVRFEAEGQAYWRGKRQ
jgi:hypothetical protein